MHHRREPRQPLADDRFGLGHDGVDLLLQRRGVVGLAGQRDFMRVQSVRTTAMLFTILIAAMLFPSFVNFTTMPGDLKDWILHAGLSPLMVVGAMMVPTRMQGRLAISASMAFRSSPMSSQAKHRKCSANSPVLRISTSAGLAPRCSDGSVSAA